MEGKYQVLLAAGDALAEVRLNEMAFESGREELNPQEGD